MERKEMLTKIETLQDNLRRTENEFARAQKEVTDIELERDRLLHSRVPVSQQVAPLRVSETMANETQKLKEEVDELKSQIFDSKKQREELKRQIEAERKLKDQVGNRFAR